MATKRESYVYEDLCIFYLYLYRSLPGASILELVYVYFTFTLRITQRTRSVTLTSDALSYEQLTR